jgi:hypothetical protein
MFNRGTYAALFDENPPGTSAGAEQLGKQYI